MVSETLPWAMSASQHSGVSLKSSELWPALRDHTNVWTQELRAVGRVLGTQTAAASRISSWDKPLKSLKQGTYLFLKVYSGCREKDGMRESTNIAEGSRYPNSQKSREETQWRSYLGAYNLNCKKVSMTLVFDVSLHAIQISPPPQDGKHKPCFNTVLLLAGTVTLSFT